MTIDAATAVEERAAVLLRELAGPDAAFRAPTGGGPRPRRRARPRAVRAAHRLGESAVYFIAAALLRERGAGPALIVSPLLALMPDRRRPAAPHPRGPHQTHQTPPNGQRAP